MLKKRSSSGATADPIDDDGHDDCGDRRPPAKIRKRYHRHTPKQIQELEAMFKDCPHPDEKQRWELSKRLDLDPRQIKFWFQNRRTQIKAQTERQENSKLRQENEKLRAENMSMKDWMRNPVCASCCGPAMLGEASSVQRQRMRMENTRLKDELDRVCDLARKFVGLPGPGTGSVGLGNFCSVSDWSTSTCCPSAVTEVLGRDTTASLYLEIAQAAMEEMMKMVKKNGALWIEAEDGSETLNYDEYLRMSPRFGTSKVAGFAREATRESGMVMMNSMALVDSLMDPNRWADLFPCIVSRASTMNVINNGIGGSKNGALHHMTAELQVLSPLVPTRSVSFLRFCKRHADGGWAVVDVSVDGSFDTPSPPSCMACRRLPSGCVVQELPSGYSKVTWVEHAEYDETMVHLLYRPFLRSGMGFGAKRWLSTLRRQCECLAISLSYAVANQDHQGITLGGRRSMLRLAQRMTSNFCGCICASATKTWDKLNVDSVGKDVRVMTRNNTNMDNSGEPPGVVLSATTSVWLPHVTPQRLFDFLRDEQLRSEWDILSSGGPMQEIAHIAKNQDPGNCVSLLSASAMNEDERSSMLILQETCTDASGSLVVYAPVDIPAMQDVMNGGDSATVALLPSGFSVVPDGSTGGGGSLLTVAFQILVNSLPNAKLTVDSVETVNNLISCTIHKIKSSLRCQRTSL